jgi:hypothetical protein
MEEANDIPKSASLTIEKGQQRSTHPSMWLAFDQTAESYLQELNFAASYLEADTTR